MEITLITNNKENGEVKLWHTQILEYRQSLNC